MGMHEYEVTVNGADTTLLLDDEEAKTLYPGAKRKAAAPTVTTASEQRTAETKKASAPADKSAGK